MSGHPPNCPCTFCQMDKVQSPMITALKQVEVEMQALRELNERILLQQMLHDIHVITDEAGDVFECNSTKKLVRIREITSKVDWLMRKDKAT